MGAKEWGSQGRFGLQGHEWYLTKDIGRGPSNIEVVLRIPVAVRVFSHARDIGYGASALQCLLPGTDDVSPFVIFVWSRYLAKKLKQANMRMQTSSLRSNLRSRGGRWEGYQSKTSMKTRPVGEERMRASGLLILDQGLVIDGQ